MLPLPFSARLPVLAALCLALLLGGGAVGAAEAEAKRGSGQLKIKADTRGADARAVAVKIRHRTPRRGRDGRRPRPSRRLVAVQQSVDGHWRTLTRKRPNRRGRLKVVVSPRGEGSRARLRARSRAPRLVSRATIVRLPAAPAPPAAPSPPAQPSSPTPPPPAAVTRSVPVGFNNNAVTDKVASPAESADLLADAGADIDRVQVAWKTLEPNPGEYHFATTDAIYQADVARGIKPLFILGFAPRWASGTVCADAPSNCHAPPSPEHYDDYARAAAALATRYPQAAGIEIWNEPNAPYFWQPGPDPQAYTALLAAAYDAIKAANPAMPVAGAATASGVAGSPGKIRATRFITEMYQHGAAAKMDAVSIHVYPDPGVGVAVSAVLDVLAVRNELGDSSVPVWITETGATTSGTGALAEAEQALLLAGLDAALRSIPDVEMVLFHTLVEPPRGATNPETGYGLVAGDGRRKPAYCGLAFAWGNPGAC